MAAHYGNWISFFLYRSAGLLYQSTRWNTGCHCFYREPLLLAGRKKQKIPPFPPSSLCCRILCYADEYISAGKRYETRSCTAFFQHQ